MDGIIKKNIIKTSVYLLGICLFAFLVSCNYSSGPQYHMNDIKWMQEESGVILPPKTQYLAYENPTEFGSFFKCQLDSTEIEEFIVAYNLNVHQTTLSGLVFQYEIENADRDFFSNDLDSKQFFYHTDCKSGFAWNILAEKKTGNLWFEVLYADFAGDGPPCYKDNDTITP